MAKEFRIEGFAFGFGLDRDAEHEARAKVDFGPGFDELFDEAVKGARGFKEEAVVNGPVDLDDICVAVLPEGSFHCPIKQMCEEFQCRAPDAIAISLGILAQTLGRPIAVMVLMESVYRTAENLDDLPPVGSISQAWHEGKSGIGEALSVVIATPDRLVMEFMPFHYGGGSIEWDESSRREIEGWPDCELDENVAMAIRMGFVDYSQEGGTDGTG